MGELKSKFEINQVVWWVHCSSKVYKGTVKQQDLCHYQGAVYLILHSPSFRRNTTPVVHYSNVFETLERAREYAEWQKGDKSLPICQGCKYNVDGKYHM